MATLYVWQAFELSDGKCSGGSRSNPVSITVDGRFERRSKSLVDVTTWDAWETGDDNTAITNFDFLYISSDTTVRVELVVDKAGGSGGPGYIPIIVTGGVPQMINSDDALAGYTANFGAGTASVINQIRVRNVSGGTAIVELVLIT